MVINPPWQLAVTVGRKSWSMDAWHSIWNNKIQISCWHHYANQGLGPIWINFKEKKNNWMTWLLSFWIIFLTRADRWPQRWQVPLRRTNEVFTFFWINKCVIYWNVIVHTNFPFFFHVFRKRERLETMLIELTKLFERTRNEIRQIFAWKYSNQVKGVSLKFKISRCIYANLTMLHIIR